MDFYDRMRTADVVDEGTFATVIRCLGQLCLWEEAEVVCKHAEEAGYSAHEAVLAAVIEVYGVACRWDAVDETVQVRRRGAQPLPFAVYSALLQAYSKGGRVQDLRRTESELERDGVVKDSRAYRDLIRGYSKASAVADVWRVWQEFVEAEGLGDSCVYASAIAALGRALQLDKVRRVQRIAEEQKVHSGGLLATLISVFGRFAHDSEEVERLQHVAFANHAPPPDIAIYTALLGAYGALGLFDQCTEVRKHMAANGVAPGVLTYVQLILGYGSAEKFAEVDAVVHDMEQGVSRWQVPDVFAALIKVYASAFRVCSCGGAVLWRRRGGVLWVG